MSSTVRTSKSADRWVTQTFRHRCGIVEKANSDSGNSTTTLIKVRGNRADARDEARRRSLIVVPRDLFRSVVVTLSETT